MENVRPHASRHARQAAPLQIRSAKTDKQNYTTEIITAGGLPPAVNMLTISEEPSMIHIFKMHDTNIVLDVNSGAVHILDDLAYSILEQFTNGLPDEADLMGNAMIRKLIGEHGEDEVLGVFSELKELKNMGQLFSDDPYEDYFSKQAQAHESQPIVKALCLHIAHDCNLRCRYCFASTGDFGTKRSLMSAQTGKRAIDFLIEKSASRRNLEVDFFGGEPLLNFEVVKEIVLYALEREKETGKNFRFTITTNAVLLNEDNMKFINEHMGNVVLSIDGRPQVNDAMRFRVDGRGTYADILPQIMEMAASRKQDNYYVRGTFTRENLDFSRDVIHLADLGFKQISIEPVVAAKESGFDIRQEDLPTLFREYENLALEYVNRYRDGNGFNFFHFMMDLDQGPCVIKRMKGCGSGNEYLAVTPEGDLYPCHQFVGMDQFLMGNVNLSKDVNMEIHQMFVKHNIYTKPECGRCWAKFFCSGGCAANAWQFNNCLDKPYDIGCELERKRLECALWAKAVEFQEE